jgi:hypothetical protein
LANAFAIAFARAIDATIDGTFVDSLSEQELSNFIMLLRNLSARDLD